MTSAMIRESVGITSPITHMGRVVYNAKRDFLDTRRRKSTRGCARVYEKDGFGDDECHTIQQYELCFRHRHSVYKNWTPNDTDLSVFSNTNGLVMSMMDKTTAETNIARDNPQALQNARLQYVRDKIEFAGVACNRAIYDPHNNANEEMLAVQVGGLNTIYNSGDKTIYAGDIIYWEMPIVHDVGSAMANQPKTRFSPGTPRIKRMFATMPLRSANILAALQAPGRRGDSAEATYSKNMFNLQRRIIGKAMSTAQVGQPFDILLGHYCI